MVAGVGSGPTSSSHLEVQPLVMLRGRKAGGSPMSPLGAVVRGLVAGAVGTAAMDLVWYRRYQRGGGEDGFVAWEFSKGLRSWDDAPAPALVGRRLVTGLLQRELPPSRARLTSNVTHWAYGMGWGSLHGIVAGTVGPRRVWYGIPFGAAVWASSYVVLPAAGLYKPIWQYDARTLARDLSAHVAFGMGSAVSFAAMSLV